MRYLGGKARTASTIARFLQPYVDLLDGYVEPFVGGAWVLSEIKCASRNASDNHAGLIAMWQAVQKGWVPPSTLSQNEYASLKMRQDMADPLTAFAGFGCSFAGKYFGGYARAGDRNYASNAKNSILRKQITNVLFAHKDYRECDAVNSVVYCDPPYKDTTGYHTNFDHVAFWVWARRLSERNLVFVSEYVAPPGFRCVFEVETKTDMRVASGQKARRVEKIFTT